MRDLGVEKRCGLSIVTSVPVSSESERERERKEKTRGWWSVCMRWAVEQQGDTACVFTGQPRSIAHAGSRILKRLRTNLRHIYVQND